MKKQLIAAIATATMLTSTLGGLSAGAFDEWSYAEDVSVYVNGTKIEDEYKPIIVNNRTLVRLVPIFEALGYDSQYDEATKSATFGINNANASYRFTAESNEATILGTGATSENNNSSYPLDVPATLQYYDVFYVPIRAFCEMVGLNIEWNNATRSVYITGNKDLMPSQEKKLLTYDEAKEIATKYVNDTDILLGGDRNLVSHNGRQAYAFVMRSKSMVENGGSGTMGMTIYIYADNGETDTVEEAPGAGTNNGSSSNPTVSNPNNKIGMEYCCFGRIVGKGTLQEFEEEKYNYNQLTTISEAYIEKAPDYKTSTGLKPQEALDIIETAFGQSFSGTAHIYSDYIEVHAVKDNLSENEFGYFRVNYCPNGSSWAQTKNVPCYEVYACGDESFSDKNTSGKVVDMNNNIIGTAN